MSNGLWINGWQGNVVTEQDSLYRLNHIERKSGNNWFKTIPRDVAYIFDH
jgi:hypothetical protein